MTSPPPLSYPDEKLTSTVVSLDSLCDKYKDLLWSDEYDIPAFVRLALAGRFSRGPDSPQHPVRKYVVNVRRDAFVPSSELDYTCRGDFDSAVGQTSDLPFIRPLAVYPIPPFRDTLKKNNHCKGLAYGPNVKTFSIV
jgi:hypothetical protein